jgi:immune inhibitor A
MHRKQAGLLLVVLLLAACALPIAPQPTVAPLAPTATPPAARLPAGTADSVATPQLEQAGPTMLLAPTAPLPVPTALGPGADELIRIDAASPLPRDQVALAEALKGIGNVPVVARATPLDVQVGDVETFWVANFVDHSNFQVEAKLRYAGPVVLMYVDTRIEANVDQAAIEQSAHEFEQKIYPRNHALFRDGGHAGRGWRPATDGAERAGSRRWGLLFGGRWCGQGCQSLQQRARNVRDQCH